MRAKSLIFLFMLMVTRAVAQIPLPGSDPTQPGAASDAQYYRQLGTPYRVYYQKLYALVGINWNILVRTQSSARTNPIPKGMVTIVVNLDPSGRVASTSTTSAGGNERLASVSLEAIHDCKFPPVPDELARFMRDGTFPVKFIFTLYNNPRQKPNS